MPPPSLADNKRQVKVGRIINETYTATKDTTSYVGALRVGAPLTWGSLIFEPQATAIWNGNEDASYKESGRYRAFALKVNSYSDNFLETTVGAKLAWPIKQENGNLLVPNLKVAWLADWDTGNEAVKFKRAHSRLARSRTAEIPSNQETQNGVLVEGGIDYAIFQGPTSAGSSTPKAAPRSGPMPTPTGAPQAASPSSSDQRSWICSQPGGRQIRRTIAKVAAAYAWFASVRPSLPLPQPPLPAGDPRWLDHLSAARWPDEPGHLHPTPGRGGEAQHGGPQDRRRLGA